MKKLFQGIVFASILTQACAKFAHADTSKGYKLFYINQSGTQIDATKALLASLKGDQVYKCQSVESKVSKAGTSIGLHNIKKPKAE